MKLLVLASYAQFGVGAGRQVWGRAATACGGDPLTMEAFVCGIDVQAKIYYGQRIKPITRCVLLWIV